MYYGTNWICLRLSQGKLVGAQTTATPIDSRAKVKKKYSFEPDGS